MLRLHIAVALKILHCIFSDCTAAGTHIQVAAVDVSYRPELLRSVRISFNNSLSISNPEQMLIVLVCKTRKLQITTYVICDAPFGNVHIITTQLHCEWIIKEPNSIYTDYFNKVPCHCVKQLIIDIWARAIEIIRQIIYTPAYFHDFQRTARIVTGDANRQTCIRTACNVIESGFIIVRLCSQLLVAHFYVSKIGVTFCW